MKGGWPHTSSNDDFILSPCGEHVNMNKISLLHAFSILMFGMLVFMRDFSSLVLEVLRPAGDARWKLWIIIVIQIDPLRTMNVCTKFNSNVSNVCWDISACTKVAVRLYSLTARNLAEVEKLVSQTQKTWFLLSLHFIRLTKEIN